MDQRERSLPRADLAAVAVCAMTCEDLYDALPSLDGYLPGQIRTATGDLADAEVTAARALAARIAAIETLEQRLAEVKHQVLAAAADAAAGRLPGADQARLLGPTLHKAVRSQAEATNALHEHLRLARLILADQVDDVALPEGN